MFSRIQGVWKKAIGIAVLGAGLALAVKINHGTSGRMLVADMLFSIGMMFFFWGMMHLIGNMGMFNSLKYGAKCLLRALRNQKNTAGDAGDGYIEYVHSHRKHQDVPVMMLFAVGFISLSVLASFIVM